MDSAELSGVERRLVEAAESGQVLDLAPEGEPAEPDEESMRVWSSKRTIRAAVVRRLMSGANAEQIDPKGVRMRGVLIDEIIDLDHLRCSWPLELEYCYLRGGLTARSMEIPRLGLEGSLITSYDEKPVLDLRDTSIQGSFLLNNAIIYGSHSPLINATSASIEGVFSMKGTRMFGGATDGAIRLVDAMIGGRVDAKCAMVANPAGPALIADRVVVNKSIFLNNARIDSSSGRGAVKIPGAKIGGQLSLRGIYLRNSNGPALDASRMEVSGSVFVDKSALVMGAGGRGAINLLGASIGGKFDLRDSKVSNEEGPALFADSLKVMHDLMVDRSILEGCGTEGVMRLRLAKCGGLLSLSGARITSLSGPALMANGITIEANARLDAFYWSDHAPGVGVVSLRGASIGGRFLVRSEQIYRAQVCHRWDYVDMTFGAFEISDVTSARAEDLWVSFLSRGGTEFPSAVFGQFATISRKHGNERLARRFMVAQRWARLQSGHVGTVEKVWEMLLFATIGFGYRHSWALAWMLALFIVSCAVSGGMFGGGLKYVAEAARPGAPCGLLDFLGYNMQLVFPFVESAAQGVCETDETRSGAVIRVAGMVVQAASWALSLLFVAGFTRAVRKY